MAAAIVRMAQEPLLAQTMAAAAKRFVTEKFSIEGVARQHEVLYRALVGQ